MRCAWCDREAVAYVKAAYVPPCCDDDACGEASNGVNNALWDARDRDEPRLAEYEERVGREAITAVLRAVGDATDAVEARDAREQRGEPADMSGWRLW